MDVVTTTVRAASAADADALAATMAEAFLADPVMSWCYPEPAKRLRVLDAFFRRVLAAALPYGGVLTVEGEVAGGIWIPPTADIDSALLAADIVALSGEYGDRVQVALELLDANHPTGREHQYLFLLGTRDAWQSRGLGSALIRAVTVGCDLEGMGAYLEATSERNRSLYERHGFEVTRVLTLPEGPPLFCMWREPAPPSR